jgi:hypothetical protein
VAKREDSETYAKRTISEIENCLGFRFQPGGAEEQPAEAMDDKDLKARRLLRRVRSQGLDPVVPGQGAAAGGVA